MYKRKVTKTTKKASVKRISRVSSKGFFEEHKNLRWLLPLLAVALIGLFLVHYHVQKELSGAEYQSKKDQIKTEIKEKFRIDTDKETMDDTESTTQENTSF